MNKILEVINYTVIVIITCSCQRTETIVTFDDGKVKLECEISKGMKNGKCKGYYSNGNLEFISYYKNDTLNGSSKFFHDNGQLHWEVEFLMGVKNGKIKYYDSLGRLYQQSSFKDNDLQGESFSYYPDGAIQSEMNYNMGELDGIFKSYYKDGNIKMKAEYSQGELIDFVKFDTSGKIIDHNIKFEIEKYLEDDELTLRIAVINKTFDVVGLKVNYKTGEGSLKSLKEVYTEGNILKFKVDLEQNIQNIYMTIFEIEEVGDKSQNTGIIRSTQDFKYVIKN